MMKKRKESGRAGKSGENAVHVNIVRGDLVDALTVTAAEYAERYAGYDVIADETGDDGLRRVTLSGAE